MPKWKLWGDSKIYLGHSDDFEFVIQNDECTEILGNFGQESFQGFSFDIFSTESLIWNPKADTQTIPCLRDCENT